MQVLFKFVRALPEFSRNGSKLELSLTPHLERVLVVLAALRAAEPGEVVVDPGLRGTRDVGHVRLQRPQLDLRLQRVRVAAARPAYPVLQWRR